jgi:hypothetical protein
MAKPTLFLLKPGFHEDKGGPFFCPDCAAVEGFLRYAPEAERQLDVHRIDFPRPRKDIVALIGAENQSCPVLVFEEGVSIPAEAKRSLETGKAFISGSLAICEFLGRSFGVARPHT